MFAGKPRFAWGFREITGEIFFRTKWFATRGMQARTQGKMQVFGALIRRIKYLILLGNLE
jgi:hypothetical protein